MSIHTLLTSLVCGDSTRNTDFDPVVVIKSVYKYQSIFWPFNHPCASGIAHFLIMVQLSPRSWNMGFTTFPSIAILHLASPSSQCWRSQPRASLKCWIASTLSPLRVNTSTMVSGPKYSYWCVAGVLIWYARSIDWRMEGCSSTVETRKT